jgi:hypothetical protein
MIKIAVYFCGHFRILNETWKQYQIMFKNTEQFTFDFYFGLWNKMDTKDDTIVKEQDVLNICSFAKNIVIFDSNTQNENNLVNQLYCIYNTVEMLPSSYDYYIRMRTDLYYFDFNFLYALKQLNNCIEKPNLLIPSNVWYNQKNYPHTDVFNDYMWIADYKTTKYIASLYNEIPVNNSMCLENLFAYHISKQEYIIWNFKCCFNIDRRTRGNEMHLLESNELTTRRQNEGDYYA